MVSAWSAPHRRRHRLQGELNHIDFHVLIALQAIEPSGAGDFEAKRAFGAHGERVTEPGDLSAAIDRAFAALNDGKAAVLHIHVTRL